jgi:hypothetical protein
VSIEDVTEIDFVADDPSGRVALIISDHLDWGNPNEHLFSLQEKINTYCGFTESGQLVKQFPNTKGRQIVILVMAIHPVPDDAERFFAEVAKALEHRGYIFEVQQTST